MNMKPASIEFITGVMNSGKSYDLIERIEEAEERGLSYLILKPSIDTRDGAFVKSRKTDTTYPAVVVDETELYSIAKIIHVAREYEVIFIDEVQFFSEEFIENLVILTFLNGVAIVASGLTRDFKGDIFPASKYLSVYSTEPIEFREAVCHCCGKENATVDVRMDAKDKIVTKGDSVSVEGSDNSYHYETVCIKCFEEKGGY